jgi:pSer/pThr/pTyr-binding forkhead associated (FHA) protein
MISCPDCQADNPPEALRCGVCDAELPADEHSQVATIRTRPKLLILRALAKAADRPAARLTDHGSTAPAETPVQTPAPVYRLQVIRGLRVNVEYPLCEGQNLIGRSDDRPVDIDLRDQEPVDRVWASRQHAVFNLAGEALTVEDMHSTNGTYVNRHRLPPGTKRNLKDDDVVQIGTVQLKINR